jgi:hypothetical protein
MSALSIPDLVAAVQVDLAARGYTATKVVFGDWEATKHKGADYVIFGLRGFEFEAPNGQAPGPYFQDPIAMTSQARALYSRVQACQCWVTAAPSVDAKDPLRAEKSQVATAALLHAVTAALWRAATGSLDMGPGEWPKPEQQQFLYGSLATFTFKLWVPVLDDAMQFITPNAAASTTTTYLAIGGANYQAAKTP